MLKANNNNKKKKKKVNKLHTKKKSKRDVGVTRSTTNKSLTKTKKSKKSKKEVTNKKKLPIVTIAETPVIESTKKTKRARKPKEKMYFTGETEDAIIQYNATENQSDRDEIYNTQIKYAFEKLVENVFNTFKFCYFETSPLEVQKETVAHLVANIHKFESGKGKAFSYFSIIAKNYLIFQNNSNYKRFNQHVEIGEDNGENTCKLQHEDPYYKEEENREFISMMVSYWEKNVNKIFTKQRDINIANAVIELFRNSDRIDAFNKKALYLYIREISSCKTQQITKVINRMKNYQNNITKSYVNNGIL
jgi:hypothetical protein